MVNKVDRDGARPEWVVNHTFDLFDKLGASEEQLDFPVVYASALEGWAAFQPGERGSDLRPLFETILGRVPAPRDVDTDGPLQLQISALDWSSYVGRIGVGRIRRGRLRPADEVMVHIPGKPAVLAKVNQVFGFQGLERVQIPEAVAGDIVQFTGVDELSIGCTLCDPEHPEPLPAPKVDEPTITMHFQVNTSPFAGTEGKFITSRQIRERLQRELFTNVALRVEDTADADVFLVSGRGELHLAILVENMRREGYELAVGRPRVITRDETALDGELREPYELLTVDVEDSHQGAVMQALGERRSELLDMVPDGRGRVRLEYRIPARGADRLPGRIHEPDARQRADQPRVRRLRRVERRHPRAAQWRADFAGRRRGGGFRAVQSAGARPPDRRPRRSRCTRA